MKSQATLLAAFVLFAAGRACAHSFGTAYNLPVPFWLYAYGASGTLAVSFALVAYFAGAHSDEDARARSHANRWLKLPRPLVAGFGALSVGLLALCIATGLFGTQNVYANFNMTFFWLLFALGFLYSTAVIGDVYGFVNPWRVLCDAAASVAPGRPILDSYPKRLGYYPALVLYFAFVWFELFGDPQPFSLAVALIVYTVITLGGAFVFGREAWFRHGEFFAVMFRLVGLMAPVAYTRKGDDVSVSRRRPLAGLLEKTPDNPSLLLFVLFMLSSTAFDGMHETMPWSAFFWNNIFPVLTAGTAHDYAYNVRYYYYWEWFVLIASPFLYLAVFLAFVAICRLAAGSRKAIRDLALAFTLSLVPIAFVYNVTHYFTLLVSQGVQIVALASDPFGVHWNLLGTASSSREPVILDASAVWHTQVALILIGHVLGVCVSHVEALRVFRGTPRALASQVPMLVLMILFTIAGLWILSLPIAGGQVVLPPTT